MTARTRILIADDHTMVHIGLSTMLEAFDEFELVGLVASGEEALEFCEKFNPDIVLMDIMMPGMGGIEAIRQVNQKYSDIHILALTSFEDPKNVRAAMEAGASGYLLKNLTAQELAEAIKTARIGRVTLAPEAAQAMVEASRQAENPYAQLTARELEVLEFLAKGLSNTQIADELIVSQFTIKTHVSNILSKLEASTRAEAVAIAYQQGIIEN